MPLLAETRYAEQSVTVEEVLDAINILLRKATGFDARRVIEWHHSERPSVDIGPSIVWFRHVSRSFDEESGAVRYGTKCDLLLAVNLTTRDMTDGAQRDNRIGRSHLASLFQIENAIHGRMLHSSYEDRVDQEPPKPTLTKLVPPADLKNRRLTRSDTDPYILTVGTMVITELPAHAKTRPEQGYIETSVGVKIPVVLRATVQDVPELTD
jgi:hypothetical protein